MGILNKAKEAMTMNWPDRPWSKELPEKQIKGRRLRKFQTDMEGRTETHGKCDKCNGPARIVLVYITRKYDSEDSPYYDRWVAQCEVQCNSCGAHRLNMTDEEIDKSYERKG